MISDKRCFEVIDTSSHTLSVGLLQCSAGRNNWHLDKTATIITEYWGSFSVWSLAVGPHHSSALVVILVWKCIHGVAPPYLQEFCVPVEKLPGRPRLRSASAGCVNLPKVTYVGRPAQLHYPRAHSLEQSDTSSAWQQLVTEHASAAAEDPSRK